MGQGIPAGLCLPKVCQYTFIWFPTCGRSCNRALLPIYVTQPSNDPVGNCRKLAERHLRKSMQSSAVNGIESATPAQTVSLLTFGPSTFDLCDLTDVPLSQVGNQFISQFYTVMHSSPKHLHRFYSDRSTLTHVDVVKEADALVHISKNATGQKVRQRLNMFCYVTAAFRCVQPYF